MSSSDTSQARCAASASASCRVIAFAASSRRTTSIAHGSSTDTAEGGIAERALIESIAAELTSSQRTARLIRGIGDDAAVVRARAICVTSVDAMVEGVHFRLDEGWASAGEVGHRALAGALSALAAVGGDPGEAYVVLGLPAGFGVQPRHWPSIPARLSPAATWSARRPLPCRLQLSAGGTTRRHSSVAMAHRWVISWA